MRSLLQWPCADWASCALRAGHGTPTAPRKNTPLSAEHANDLIHGLVDWRPRVVAGVDEEEALSMTFKMECWASRLAVHRDSFHTTHHHTDADRILRVLRTFSAANHLRSRSQLHIVRRTCMEVAGRGCNPELINNYI